MVVFNPLCPVRFSLLLYCIYFCFSVPNKTINNLFSFQFFDHISRELVVNSIQGGPKKVSPRSLHNFVKY